MRTRVGKILSGQIRNDHEPWYRGDPELQLKIGSASAGLIWGGTPTTLLYSILLPKAYTLWGTSGAWIRYFWYERDGGDSVSISTGAGSTSFTFNIQDGDDQMGWATVFLSEKYKIDTHDTGDVVWKRTACAWSSL